MIIAKSEKRMKNKERETAQERKES
jgi:hypothetical protein